MMNMKNVMPSEISHSERKILYDIAYMEIEKNQINRARD